MKKLRVFSLKKMQLVNNIVIAAVLAMICSVAAFAGTIEASGQKSEVYYHGNTSKKQVTLAINVYWGTEFLTEILDCLDKYGAKTTFFLGGSWADDNISLVNDIAARGHEIGNHGYFHKDHKKISFEKNIEEIKMCNEVVEKITKKRPTLFAPPSGAFGAETIKAAKQEDCKVIMWTRDTIDWRDKDTSLITKRATNKMAGGDIVLMHPTKNTLEALPAILEYIKSNGFSCVTTSQNIS